ncbi:AI-2E family transporter [Hydrococcus rivularis NIES-593]|uniref:AI-2E family transporter n=1 Tax=Hydrococcus rivularis NIES-593 TaxID=1921803 RepID=A0A1U7HJQ5_9CYAN|nr:AI-2E family transporter [Hydrococcus rivularis]OKH23799.1 AI-2E family transporter [Hydrococcus rivularis NIES-593]
MHFRQWLGLLVLVLSLYILWQIRQIVLLFFAAVVLATVLNRVVRQMQRYRIQRGIAIAITVVVLLAAIVGFFVAIAPRIIEQLQQLVNLLPKVSNQLEIWSDWLQSTISGPMLERFQGFENLSQQLQTWIGRMIGNFFVLINNSLAAVVSLLLFLVLTVMLLTNPSQYRRIFILAFPAFYRRRVDEILQECETSLVGWIKGTLIAMLVIGVVSFIGLSILGVPLPLINAALAGLLEFIPNVGPTLSVIPPALLALLDSPWKAGAVILLYIAIQQFESLVLVPIIMKQEVDLLPVFTILAVVVFASLFGFLGLFLAIPLLIVLQIWIKEVLVEDVLNKWYLDNNGKSR